MQRVATRPIFNKPIAVFLTAMWLLAFSFCGAIQAQARQVNATDIVAINGFEQLQQLDSADFIGILPHRGLQATRSNENNRKSGFTPAASVASVVSRDDTARAVQGVPFAVAQISLGKFQAAHGCRAPPV